MFRPIAVILGVAAASALLAAAPAPAPSGVYAIQNPPPQQPQRQTELNVTLSNKGTQLKVGIQAFTAASASLREAADTIASVLGDDLHYEREFYVISRKATASIPAGATPETLPFEPWRQIGASLVVMGSLRETGGKLEVGIKMIEVGTGSEGKEYYSQTYGGCTVANARFCAHSIADDIHLQKRQVNGVARTRIAFTSDRADETMKGRPIEDPGRGKEIYMMDYDGAQARRLTVSQSISVGASWGPDARTLAYFSFVSEYPDVYLMTLDGRPVTRPARGNSTNQNQNPAISPDGKRIAFTSKRGGANYDIWVVNVDGSNPQNLTPGTDKWFEGAPSWSPNGAQIAFYSDRTGAPQIYVMNADGTGVQKIPCGPKCDRPAWSALNYIAYTLERPGGKDIAVTDLSKMEPRIVTDGLGSNEQPSVSPNGRHIAFVTSRWGNRQIATIDFDGQFIRQISNAGTNTYPNWSPTPGGR